MELQKVYAVFVSGEIDGEVFSDILGLYAYLSDAKDLMAQDIESIKEDWDHIDFNNPEQWVESKGETSYEGYTPYSNYTYSINIQELPVH